MTATMSAVETVLETIHTPADLRRLDGEAVERLAADIRRVLVETVASTGGHLGSNLGAVELTIGLHRVLDSPADAIIWDTGHQAYTHKLLTGRWSRFATLRQAEGLSGYPSRAESPHDWIENSHASTALSYAFGLAAARAQAGDHGRVVAVVGDGALTGGMAYEGLNNIGWRGLPVVIVLNDNGRSYAPTVSKLIEHLSPLRVAAASANGNGAGPARSPDGGTDHGRPAGGGDGRPHVDPIAAREQQGRALGDDGGPIGRGLFAALGVGYLGPVDGHDVAAVEDAMRAALAAGRPTVVHVLTRKGRGFAPAEDDDDKCLHDVAPFQPRRYAPPARSQPRYTDVFSQAVVRAGQRDHRVVAITAAMPSSTGLRPFAEAFPERFFDVGIAEQHAVTGAAGMAMGGLRPVVAIYSSFLSRAFDQLNLDVGLHRLPVVLCIDRAGITGPDGPSHHGVLDMALLSRIPGLTLFAPSSAAELEVMLDEALAIDGPCALRWPNGTARRVPDGAVGQGRAGRRVRCGDDVCILAVGPLLEAAEAAADDLAHQGVSATLWDVRVVKPLDPDMIADAAGYRLVVTVEDGVREGGAGSGIVDALARYTAAAGQSETAGQSVAPPPTLVLGVPDAYIPHGNPAAIRANLGLDAAGITAAVLDHLGTRQA
jgi:1-deoxy-D-xylulose-5-phosphate synthase